MSESATPWTVAHQVDLFMRFSKQKNWSGLPCPPPGNPLNPGLNLPLIPPALAGGFFITSAIWESFVQPSIQPLFNVPFLCHWFMVLGGPWAREYYSYSVESGWVSCHIELCGPGYLPFPRGRLRVNTEINWLISIMVVCVYVSSPFLMSDLEISMLG